MLVCILFHWKWLALQEGFCTTFALLAKSQRSQLLTERNTQGNSWKPLSRNFRRLKSHLIWILLAENEARSITIRIELWQMLVIHRNPTPTFSRAKTNFVTLAVRLMGNRFVRTFSLSVRIVKIHGGHCILFHIVGRNETLRHNNIKQYQKIHVEIH